MNRVVVVTGAGGVLCSIIAKHFALLGDKTALLDLNYNSVKAVEDEITASGFTAKAYEANVLDKQSLERAYEKIKSDFGVPDILINGAGGNNKMATTDDEFFDVKSDAVKDFFALTQEGVNFVFNLNFLGTFLTTQIFAKDMALRGSGAILNISSMNSYKPLTKIPAYSGAKAAVSNFTQYLAVYFAKSGIRVNAVAPGFFSTNQNKTLLFDEKGNYTARSNKILNGTPMGRFGLPEELLGAAEFLTDGEKSAFITGVVLPVDGGFSAYSGV